MTISRRAIRLALAGNDLQICEITGKIGYASSDAAKAARKRHRKNKNGGTEKSIRSYECECGYWHNTSMSLSSYQKQLKTQ